MVKTLRQELFHWLDGFVYEGKLNARLGLKHLLRRKNHLMLCGRLDEASSCALRIGLTIGRLTKSHLCGVVPRNGLGDIWWRASEVLDCRGSDLPAVDISADEFNIHYARISA